MPSPEFFGPRTHVCVRSLSNKNRWFIHTMKKNSRALITLSENSLEPMFFDSEFQARAFAATKRWKVVPHA